MQYPFAVASHSYFLLRNKEVQKAAFLAGDLDEPNFEYGTIYEESVVHERLRNVEPSSHAHQSLQLVQASIALQNSPTLSALGEFRRLNEAAFRKPRMDYTEAIFRRVEAMVSDSTMEHWRYIQDKVELGYSVNNNVPLGPDDAMFKRYRSYFAAYDKVGLIDDISMSKEELFKAALDSTGLYEGGWRVTYTNDSTHARVSHATKRIVIGRDFTPRRTDSVRRIVAHEVFGHALRGPQPSIAEAEGVALMFEQLVDSSFKPRRTFRYLAAALGWGVDDVPRTFRQVYEILWRIMVITGSYSAEKAKQHAFDECSRVFRGGLPNVAGAVYLKDAVYFDANMSVWKKLADKPLNYEAFVDIIEGRKRVLA